MKRLLILMPNPFFSRFLLLVGMILLVGQVPAAMQMATAQIAGKSSDGDQTPLAGPVAADDILALIDRLNASRWEERNLATERLVALGQDSIEPLLSRLKETGVTPEVQIRALKVLRTLALKTEGATEQAAVKAIDNLAKQDESRLSRLAVKALTGIADKFNEQAKEELLELGAELTTPVIVGKPSVIPATVLKFGEKWQGKAADLSRLKLLTELTDIEMYGQKFDDEYIAAIAKFGNPGWLRLDRVKLTDQGMAKLASLKSLHYVAIWYCPITDESVKAISKWTNAGGQPMGAQGALGINELQLYGTKISPDGIKALQTALAGTLIDVRKGGLLGVSPDNFGNVGGGCVVNPEGGSAAAVAGIVGRDRIVKFDGEPVESFDELREAISKKSAGETVEIEVDRRGESLTVKAKLSEWDSDKMRRVP